MNFFEKLFVKILSSKDRADYYRKNKIMKIGEGCEIDSDVMIGSEPYLIELGDNVKVAALVKFITHDGGMHVLRKVYSDGSFDKIGPIKVGSNVFIGMCSMIMPNVKIGDNVVIGAHSVVTKDVPSNCVVAGVPAKIICNIEEYYKKNKTKIYPTKQMSKTEKREFYQKLYDIEF